MKKSPGALPVGENPGGGGMRARRRMDQAALRCQSWDNGSELVAQLVETVALLTQHTTIHGRIELHGLAQGHK